MALLLLKILKNVIKMMRSASLILAERIYLQAMANRELSPMVILEKVTYAKGVGDKLAVSFLVQITEVFLELIT